MRKYTLITGLILIYFLSTDANCFAENRGLRIISLAPSTTEILFALGLDKEIVGVSSFCNYPPEAQGKEKIGTFSQPNIERILSLKPDILFCTGLEQAPIVTKLRQLKLNVYVSDPSTMEELFASILDIAALTDRRKNADTLINKMKKGIGEIESKTRIIPDKDRPRVFVEFWNAPLMCAGRNSFIDELITLAGGINIAHDTGRPYVCFSPEEVLKRDPECIILTYMVNEDASRGIRERFGWKEISAVRKNRIYSDIDPDILLRAGPRAAEALNELYRRLYP